MALHVLIAGGGIGGLALAHGLRKAGISCAVYERDPAPDSRPQGYRIHIDAGGHTGLAECLPEDLFELYVATSSRTPKHQHAVFFNHQLEELGTADSRAGEADPSRAPTAVNRLTLRQVLLARLDDVLRFGHEVAAYEHHDDGVTIRFADGGSATGDILVAADGINSVIRQQLLPDAVVHDTEVRGITGKTPLDAIDDVLPDRLRNTFTGMRGPNTRNLALAPFESRRPTPEAAAELAPDVAIDPVGGYLMWLQLSRAEQFPVTGDDFWEADPQTLHQSALKMLDGWHPDVLRLVERADQSATFPLGIRAVLPMPAWPTGPVTLLGDAIHAMTPVGGRGGNTALSDAALLTRHLAAAERGEVGLLDGIAAFEEEMREGGYAAVKHSLRNAVGIGAESPYQPEEPPVQP